MLGYLGDIHGDVRQLEIAEKKFPDDVAAIIQVGDIGWYRQNFNAFMNVKLNRSWYFIRGNHEQHDALLHYMEVTELAPNLFYVPNGTVLELDGKNVGFLGGAGSVDAAFNSHWSPLEQITDAEVAKFDGVDKVDILVTHTPPQETISAHFNPMDLVWYFGLSKDWKDPSAAKVQQVWEKFGRCPLRAGHMHRSLVDGNVRLLNINEVFAD